MSGECVEKLSHPSCGSKDGLQVFEDKGRYTGFCFRCGTYIPNPYEDGTKPKTSLIKKTPEQIQQEIKDISTFPSHPLPTRKLEQYALDYFDVKIGVDESDGVTPRYVFFPYYNKLGDLLCYKTRVLDPKKMWWIGKGDRMPFGWHKAIQTGAKKLMVVEGEFDVVALYQICKMVTHGTKYEQFNPAIISFPNGASSVVKDFGKQMNEIRRYFSEIIYVPDQDEAGRAIVDELVRTYPAIKIADLPCKDVNEGLIEGRIKAVHKAVMWQSSKPKNTRIIKGSQLVEAAKKKPEWGLSWPWQSLTDATRGIRRGETIYIGGGVKMGKSEIVNALATHLIVEHNLPVFMCKPEEAVAKSYQRLVGKAVHRIFHDPKVEFDEEAFDRGSAMIGDKAIILDSYQFLNWDSLREDIRYVVQNEGVKDIFIDPITCLTNQVSASEANEFLVSMTAELSAMSLDLDFTSYIFCHLKAPTSGEPHEKGGSVESRQFAGSRAMMRSCNYMIGIEGNKDPDLTVEERNIRYLVMLEDREFGNSSRTKLYWDWKTGSFSEVV